MAGRHEGTHARSRLRAPWSGSVTSARLLRRRTKLPVLSERMSVDVQAESQPVARPGSLRDIRVLAVDDHDAFREVLRELIAAAPGFVLVGQARSGEEAVHAVEGLKPELVLMDVGMPGMGGIAATRTILSRRPEVMVLLISVDDPALHPDVSALRDRVVCARKQDLRPRQLRQLWETHRP